MKLLNLRILPYTTAVYWTYGKCVGSEGGSGSTTLVYCPIPPLLPLISLLYFFHNIEIRNILLFMCLPTFFLVEYHCFSVKSMNRVHGSRSIKHESLWDYYMCNRFFRSETYACTLYTHILEYSITASKRITHLYQLLNQQIKFTVGYRCKIDE